MGLLDALHAWEQRWADTGAPVSELLAPGISASEVRSVLGREHLHRDVVTWFEWHNGGTGGDTWDAVPTGRWLCDVVWCMRERANLRETIEMWEKDGVDVHFRDSYLPLLTNRDLDFVFVDQDSGIVYRWDNEGWSDRYPQMMLQVAPDLETMVRTWIHVMDLVRPTYRPGQVVFEFDSSLAPRDLLDQHVVAT